MKHLKQWLVCCVLVLISATAFSQEAKNALLIANGEYAKGIDPLTNPIPEGLQLKDALESIGFTVTLVQNANLEEMETALSVFEDKTTKEGGIAFFHYGGHAVQVNGINYLIPARTVVEAKKLKYSCLDVNKMLEYIHGNTNIVVLDSCRDNPFPSGARGANTRGLAPIESKSTGKSKTMIVYSASEGMQAQDGVFTPALIKYIVQKNKPFNDILADVSEEVSKQTNNTQQPKLYGPPMGTIYLAGIPTNVTASTGRINIFSGIAGDVYIDNTKKGTIKEDGELSVELPNGSYTIEIRSEITTWKRTAKVDSDKTAHIRLETGNILLSSDIAGEVYIDGKKYRENVKEKIPLSIKKLPPAKYTIEIRNGTTSLKKDVLVTEQHDEPIHIANTNTAETYTKSTAEQTSSDSAKNIKEQSAQRHSTRSAAPWYSLGVYAGYSLSHFTAAPFSFTGHGISFGILPLQMTFGIFDLKAAVIGYALAYKSINDETLLYHTFDIVLAKAGLKFAGFSFHIGLGTPLLWETVKHPSVESGTLTRFAISIPIDIQYAFNNYISMYVEYAPTFPVGNRAIPLFKHSFNIGASFNCVNLY